MYDDPQSLQPLLDMNDHGHGRRDAGRAVAARVPEATQRTSTRRPVHAKKEGLTRRRVSGIMSGVVLREVVCEKDPCETSQVRNETLRLGEDFGDVDGVGRSALARRCTTGARGRGGSGETTQRGACACRPGSGRTRPRRPARCAAAPTTCPSWRSSGCPSAPCRYPTPTGSPTPPTGGSPRAFSRSGANSSTARVRLAAVKLPVTPMWCRWPCVVVEAEQQRADAVAVLVPAEPGDDAVDGALVLDLDHRALARAVHLVGLLRHHPVEARAFPAVEPHLRDVGVGRHRRDVDALARSRRARRRVGRAARRRVGR